MKMIAYEQGGTCQLAGKKPGIVPLQRRLHGSARDGRNVRRSKGSENEHDVRFHLQ